MGVPCKIRGKLRNKALADKEFPQKKVLSLVLCVAVMLSVMVMGAGAAFSDQDKIENTEAVDACSALNIIGGYEDGSYHPERNIKRSEITKMICVALNGGKEPNLATPGTPTFSDVRGTTAAWAEKYIESCVSQGIVSGVGGGRFSPAGNVTASQLAKMLLVCLGYDADIEEFTGNAWDTNVNVVATQKGIYEGLSGLDVSAALTRDNAAQMVWNALQATEVTYKYTLVSENGQLVSKVELVDKTGENGNKITLLEDKYSGAGIYEGILTGAGELGTAGKDKIGMSNVDKLNGATLKEGEVTNQIWTYSNDVTNLYMQYVKVLVNNKGDAYGVFPVAKENTVVTDIFANVKQDGDKIKIGGTSYNYDVDKTSAEKSGVVYGVVKNASNDKLYIDEIKDEVRSGDQITFISNDGDNKFDLAIVNPMTSFGKVTYVDSEKVNVTGVPGAFEEDDIIPDGLVKGDYVAVYKDSFTGNDKLVKAEKVTGKVDATKGSGSTITDVEIDGNWYTLGNKDANTPFQNAVVAKGDFVNGTGDTLTLYVINGVAYQVTKEAGGSTDTAFVIRKTDSIDADGNVQMRVLFADGSEKTIAAKDTTALSSISNGDLVTYEMEGSAYELTKVADGTNEAGGDSVVSDTSNGKFVKADKKITVGGKSYRVSSDAVVYIQYQETGSNDVKYRAMTGAELNNLGGDFTANKGCIAVIDDGLASVVVLKSSAYLPGANADKMYGYVTDAGTTREDSNGKYREFTVWTSSNEEQVVKMKATGTSIEKGDLISFDMTSDNFIEGVLSTSDGTNELTVATGAIDQFGKDYMVLFNGKDLTFDDDVKYIYVNGEEGVAGDGLEQAYETANGAYYNNVKYVVDNTTNEVVMVALNTAAEGWNKSATKPTADAVANKPTGMDVTVNGDTTQIVVSSDEAVEAGVPGEMKKNIFNGTLQEASYTVITLKGFVPQDGTYSIEQENEALGMAYSDYSSSKKKTSNYVNGEGGGEKNGDLSILLAAGKNVKLTIKDSEGEVVKTCTIDTTGLKVESVEN